MAISPEAFQALQALHDGTRMNIMHTIARELIDANLAHAGFGVLEITEAGRIWVRRGMAPVGKSRTYIVDDENVANMRSPDVPDIPDTRASVPPDWHPPLVLPPVAPSAPEELPPAPMTDGSLAWSRDRAVRAAGTASGTTDHWPPPGWLTSFMEAYEDGAEYDREIVTIDIGGQVHVYMDEESIASLEELMDFAAEHQELFWAFRRRWGLRMPTRAMQ